MAKVTALCMDTITKKSNHVMTPCAVSVCITPAAPAPLPIPYPVVANISEGITDPPMRTKFDGALICTVGSCFKACHGNEPGTLKEVVSLNTGGPCFLILGAINVFVELGMAGITGSPGFMNKAITVGASGSASGAGGAGGGGGGGSGPGGQSGGPQGPSNQSNGGGSGGGSNSGSSADRPSAGDSSNPADAHTCQNGHPVDMVSGCVVDQQIDIELPGVLPLLWKRYYHSQRRNDRAASLGPGWAHGFEQRIDRDNELVNLRDEEGRTLTFEHVGAGQSTFHRRERMWLHGTARGYRVERLSDRRIYHYERFEADDQDATAHLLRIEDKRGNQLRLVYDHGRLDHVIDTAGRKIEVKWERHGGQPRISELRVEARGRTAMSVSYQYSQAGCLIAVVDACRHSEQYEYDDKRRMTCAVIKTGAKFQYEYDDATNRCVRTWGPKGLFRVPLQYDLDKGRTYAGGEEPRIYDWNALGRMTREMTPSGILIEERAFDEHGNLIAEVDGDGEGIRYWYDELGNLTRVVDAADNETKYEYSYGRPTKRTTPDGLDTHYQYDAAGDLIGIQSPSGASFALARDERGRVTAIDGPFGRLVAYEYDSAHNVIAEYDACGRKTVYQYDALGRPISRTDALGRQTRVQYDALGRRTAIFHPDGSTSQSRVNAMGNVIERTDALGQVWSFRYSGMGVMTRLTEPDGREWKLDYTTFERLKRVTNPAGESYCFDYDEAGRVISETAFDERTQRYHYNKAGRLGRIDYADGSFREFRHDVNQRLVEETASDDSRIHFQRDAIGRLQATELYAGDYRSTIAYQRDALGRVIAEQQAGQTIGYRWDAVGRRTSRTLPDGSVTHYQYDNDDELVMLSHALPGKFSHRLDFERDPGGRAGLVHASSLHATRQEMTARFTLGQRYDDMDRMIAQRVDQVSPSNDVRQASVVRRYHYDRAGRVDRIEDQRWGTTTMAYDCADRLLSHALGSHREAFEYGRAGYIETALKKLEDGSTRTQRWELGAGNRIISTPDASYEYDERGRRVRKSEAAAEASAQGGELTTRYEWDSRDRLRAAVLPDGSRVTYRYDAYGRRQRKDHFDAEGQPIKSVQFLWDGDTLCADRVQGNDWRTFVHHPATAIPLLQAERGEVFTCVADQVGVVKELIDDAGMVAWAGSHSAWGMLREQAADELSVQQRDWTLSSPFRLLGQYHDDETGLAHTRHRYFDAETASWCSPDPLALLGGMNLFGFNKSPTRVSDPLGLSDKHEEVKKERVIVRRFDSKKNIKAARKNGIKYDPTKGSGIPTCTTNIDPVAPDKIKDSLGAISADAFIDIDVTDKERFERRTKDGKIEIVIQEDINPEDIVDHGKVSKSKKSTDYDGDD